MLSRQTPRPKRPRKAHEPANPGRADPSPHRTQGTYQIVTPPLSGGGEAIPTGATHPWGTLHAPRHCHLLSNHPPRYAKTCRGVVILRGDAYKAAQTLQPCGRRVTPPGAFNGVLTRQRGPRAQGSANQTEGGTNGGRFNRNSQADQPGGHR